MIRHKARVLFLAFTVSITPSVFVNAQDTQQKLDKVFTAFNQNRGFTGNILVAENGNLVYEKSFGYADPATKRINTAETQFPIASTTKPFTSIAILQLQEKGKLQIDDAVVKYLPDFPYPEISVRNLLAQTPGLPNIE